MEKPDSLRVTDGEWAELLCDPVLAAYVFFGVELDAFQKARLRSYWWVQTVIDSSGFSSGKTIVDFIFVNLRCLLIPDQDVGVYYPIFETGKNTFWKYYAKFLKQSPVFSSQMGRMDETGEEDGDGRSEGAACYKAFFKNGNTLFMPAPSFMKDANTQASMRFNTLLVEEWTHIDASSTGIDDQLIGRVTRPCWNQNHPIWGNHVLLTAPAKTQMHPGVKRWREHQKECDRGNPRYANISYSYKDYSNLTCHTGKTFSQEYRFGSTIETLKKTTTAKKGKAAWLGEGVGIWATDGEGWFTERAIDQCVANGRARGVKPVLSRAQMIAEAT